MENSRAGGEAPGEEQLRAEAWRTVEELNRLWTGAGQPEGLAGYFHPRMISLTAGQPERLESGETSVRDWAAFARSARIHRWETDSPEVRLFLAGQAAVVSYRYTIEFTMEGKRIENQGWDLLVLVRERERWWVVADYH